MDKFSLKEPPIMALPGESMQIKRMPLPDEVIRLEALKAAVKTNPSRLPSSVIDTAERFESYLRDGIGEYYDEETLNKVRNVIYKVVLDTNRADLIIGDLQNAGILFRERH